MTGKSNDQDLLDLIRAGDRTAFNELCDRYYSSMFRVCKKNLNNNTHDAENAVQDALANIWAGHKTISEKDDVEAFLRACAHRAAVSLLRWKHADKRTPSAEVPLNTDADPHINLDESDLAALLDFHLSQLDESMRRCIELSYIEEMNYNKIAAELGISPSTVGARIRKGRRLLRERIERILEE